MVGIVGIPKLQGYHEGQNFELKVVSLGQNEDAIAVGVLGCVSCNRNPHVTAPRRDGRLFWGSRGPHEMIH